MNKNQKNQKKLGLLLSGLMITALGNLGAEEKEVFSMAPPSAGESGFAGESVMKIEPKKDEPLKLELKDLPPPQFLKIDAVIDFNQMSNGGFGTIRIGRATMSC